MKKNGLLLTLKELIKLGIIKLKKRRKNKNKRLQQIEAFEKAISNSVPINIQNKRYLYPHPVSSSFQVNTDPLRIRDDNAKLNIQLLENKINMENQQKLIDEQQLKYKELAYDVDLGRAFLRKYGSSGFAYDDDIVVSQTEGSDSFEPQTRQPRTFEPQTVESPRFLPLQYSQKSQDEYDIAPPSETPRSVTEEDFVVEETPQIDAPSPEASKQRATPSPPKLKPMNYPFNPEKINYTQRSKPPVSEIKQWKQWYLTEGLNDASILEMNTQSGYRKALLAKLLNDYKNLRGEKDEYVLKTKDPRIVFKAIRQRLS